MPKRRTLNITIMEYAIQYTLSKETLLDINYVRRYKGLFLPVELLGERGGRITDCYKNKEESSAILWNDKQFLPLQLIKKQFRK